MSRRVLLACLIGCLGFLAFAADPKPGESPEGVLPVGPDGKPLNLDFETGTLKDWTAEGNAFAGQPVKGDTVAARRGDMKSQHQGQYWIGGYEIHRDAPQGTLTSVPFKVTHPWAAFLIGGGSRTTTCVELVRKDTGEVFHRASGLEEENMRREVVDLQPLKGKEIFIRLVDKDSAGWGHVNFDDFRFYTEKPNFPPRQQVVASAADVYKFPGLPPEKAAEAMTVPEGFTVQLFAGEPDVVQPIAFCLDDRGRVWVAEALTYPVRRPEGQGQDRIVIFEDTDGDGKFDKRTVFMEGLNLVSGLEVGFGGVWIGAAPYLMFVPVKEGEDKPSGPPQILLDGWHYEDTHETLNTFTWGPDGWLYGCHGVFTHSRVGKPGTPDNQRTPINAGIWRYHPTRHVFEVFAQGTSNPWGLDFDDYGQAFCEACVIPHLFHIIQGARYQRQAGDHFNPYTYDDIKTIADHLHYIGVTPHSGNNRSDSAGGGHAHCGTMIYQGGA
jgi:putative membrane-bound dehydrogenase-like protein